MSSKSILKYKSEKSNCSNKKVSFSIPEKENKQEKKQDEFLKRFLDKKNNEKFSELNKK